MRKTYEVELRLSLTDTDRHLAVYSNRHGITLSVPMGDKVPSTVRIKVTEGREDDAE